MAKREDEMVDSLAGDEGGAVGHWPGVSFRNGGWGGNKMGPGQG